MTPGEDRGDRSRGIGAAARTLQSHNLWHRRGEAGVKRGEGGGGSEEREDEEGGRLTVREREEDRSAALTLRYQRKGEGGQGETRGQAFFMRFIGLIKRPVVM